MKRNYFLRLSAVISGVVLVATFWLAPVEVQAGSYKRLICSENTANAESAYRKLVSG